MNWSYNKKQRMYKKIIKRKIEKKLENVDDELLPI